MLEECVITSNARFKDLPHWCPDFSNGEWDVEAKSVTDPVLSDSVKGAFRKFASVCSSLESNVMDVLGMRVDRIERSADLKAPHFRELRSLDSNTTDDVFMRILFQRATQEWLEQMNRIFVSNDHASQIWLKKYFFHKSQEPIENKHARYNDILRCCQQIRAHDIGTLPEAVDKLKISPADMIHYVASILSGVSGHGSKIFFLTASGRVGFSSALTQSGDNICLIPGGNYLQVLSSDCGRHIGCASVEGLMGDSLLVHCQDWANQCQVFHLE